jgi:large subunit ribosomal protein L6
MSRIGKQLVTLPEGVTVAVDAGIITVKGAKETLSMPVHNAVTVDVSDGVVTVTKNHNAKIAQAMWGTTVRLVENMVNGVSKGFVKTLELNGVGFRMAVQGRKLDLALGFSHPVVLDIPEGVNAEIEKNTLKISGADKQKVGQFAANIRALKPVEPYNGKGFKYDDEIVRRKEGKRASSA